MPGKIRSLMSAALSLFLCTGLSACQEEKGSDVPDPAGKTFYSTVDEYNNIDHARIWFGKDGSFTMTDDFYDGYYDLSGTWSLTENVITLDVEMSGVGNYTKVLFEIQDEKTIILRTSLAGSQSGYVFTTDKPDGSVSPGGISAPESDGTSTYYNASRKDFERSSVQFRPDGTFVFTEIQGMGAEMISGLFSMEGNMILFSNFNEEFYDISENRLWNMEMEYIDEYTLVLHTNLKSSQDGDIFTIDGTLPAVMPVTGKTEESYDMTFVHAPIPDVLDQYLPVLELYKNGQFVFTENCYAGMFRYKGWYQKTDDGRIICDVTDASEMQGFKGDDVKTIYFEYAEPNTLMLDTELCMSMPGDTFNLDSVK